MTTSIMIGREATGKGAIKVPDNCKMVGRNHAKINLDTDNGTVTIEEIDAKNGTYVNGRRIARSRALNADDEVWLGEIGPLGYQLDVSRLVKGVRTDYSEEFEEVKKVYEEYYAECKRLEDSKRKKTVLPRTIVSLLFALVALVICVRPQLLFPNATDSEAMTARITVMTVGSAVIAALNLIPFGKKEDLREKMTDLQMQYQDRYRCPRCGAKFNLNTHWKIVQSNHCPNPKCNAKYK